VYRIVYNKLYFYEQYHLRPACSVISLWVQDEIARQCHCSLERVAVIQDLSYYTQGSFPVSRKRSRTHNTASFPHRLDQFPIITAVPVIKIALGNIAQSPIIEK